jgi:hypothetical protein
VSRFDQIRHFPKPLMELADGERRPYPTDTAEREPENSMQPRSVSHCGIDHWRLRIKSSIHRRQQATSKSDQFSFIVEENFLDPSLRPIRAPCQSWPGPTTPTSSMPESSRYGSRGPRPRKSAIDARSAIAG